MGDNLVWDVAGAPACGIWERPDGREAGETKPDRTIRELRELTDIEKKKELFFQQS